MTQERECAELPDGISLREAYERVRSRLREELLEKQADPKPGGDWAQKYVAVLPDPEVATEDEMLELLHHVGTDRLESFCWERDEYGYALICYFKRFWREVFDWQARRPRTDRDRP